MAHSSRRLLRSAIPRRAISSAIPISCRMSRREAERTSLFSFRNPIVIPRATSANAVMPKEVAKPINSRVASSIFAASGEGVSN